MYTLQLLQQLRGATSFQEASGSLTPFGLDVHCHANFVCAALYGSFETNGAAQTVRVPFSSYKVDVVVGPEIWELFGACGEPVKSWNKRAR